MKKANNFQIANVQPQGAGYLLLNFFANFAWRCLINVAYKKVSKLIIYNLTCKRLNKSKPVLGAISLVYNVSNFEGKF